MPKIIVRVVRRLIRQRPANPQPEVVCQFIDAVVQDPDPQYEETVITITFQPDGPEQPIRGNNPDTPDAIIKGDTRRAA